MGGSTFDGFLGGGVGFDAEGDFTVYRTILHGNEKLRGFGGGNKKVTVVGINFDAVEVGKTDEDFFTFAEDLDSDFPFHECSSF